MTANHIAGCAMVAGLLAVLLVFGSARRQPEAHPSSSPPNPPARRGDSSTAPSTESGSSRLNALASVLRPVNVPQTFRRAQELTRRSSRNARQTAKTTSLLPAGVSAALRTIGPDLAAALPALEDTSLQLELLDRMYTLELLDIYLAEHGLEPATRVAEVLPRLWTESVHLNDVRDPAWPRHRFGRLGTWSRPLPTVSSTLTGAKLDLETVTPFPEWEVIQWTMTYSAPKQAPQLFSETPRVSPQPATLDFVLPEREARRRLAMWIVDASTDGTVVLWLNINGALHVPMCRKGPPVPAGRPDVPTHVRVTPASVLRPGRNSIKISSQPYPGDDHASSQYVGYIALVLFDREAP